MASSVGLVSQSIWEHVAILLRRLSLLSAALKEIRTGESARFPCLLPTRSLKGTILLVECSGRVCIDGGKRGSVDADWFWKLALWRRHLKDPAWVVGAQRHLYSLGTELLVFGRAGGGMYRFLLFSCVSTSSQLLGRFLNDLVFLIADRSGELEIRKPEHDMTIAVGICRYEEEPEWSFVTAQYFKDRPWTAA